MDTQQEPRKTFIVPIGPQHPALKEPGHFELTVDGEIVTAATVRLGYVHRGIEKGVEGQNWAQAMYMLERICGICSHVHATAYALGVEALAGVQVPPRAQAIRVLVAELERIHSHLLWLGVAAHEGGFDTLFMYSWRDREMIMDLLEELTGNRVNYSCNVLGGVKFDIDQAQADAIRSRHRLPRAAHAPLPEGRHHRRDADRPHARRRDDDRRAGRAARARSARRPARPACRATSASTRPTPPTRLPGQDDHRDGRRPRGQVRRAAQGAVRELPRDPGDPGQPAAGRPDRARDAEGPGGRDHQPRRGAARRAVLLPQERRRTEPGPREGAHAQPLQLGRRCSPPRRATSWPTSRC